MGFCPTMELTIQVASSDEAMALFGTGDRNLKLLRDAFDVQLTGRGSTLKLQGDPQSVEKVAGILQGLIELLRRGEKIEPGYVAGEVRRRGGIVLGDAGTGSDLQTESRADAAKGGVRAAVKPADGAATASARSEGQAEYLRAMQANDIVFCIGPAGTGKTFLAVHMAVSLLREGSIRKIFLCRPAVEAGEKLGFLPGDFQAKINPYLRPLYDALNDILEYDQLKRYLEREIIEILPLAYMRGRTLNNAFIILDEGQNTSVSQMKMFLTRMGMSSRIVVNGDVTQVDLPEGMPSGLIHAQKVIRGIPGIAWVQLQKADIVRHPLVRRIVEAYEEAES